MNLFNIRKTFAMQKAKGWPEVYFCIDLHGTIIPSGVSLDDTEDKQKFYPYSKEVLQWLCNRRDIITILWSSTPPERLPKVKEWFQENGIVFSYINENPHAKNTIRSDFSKKFYMNVILDDRAGFEPETDWKRIMDELIDIGEWHRTDKAVTWWYYAKVRNSSGLHTVFYSTTKPVIGSECMGIASPNKVEGYTMEKAPY